jgi:hypothetical protein
MEVHSLELSAAPRALRAGKAQAHDKEYSNCTIGLSHIRMLGGVKL